MHGGAADDAVDGGVASHRAKPELSEQPPRFELTDAKDQPLPAGLYYLLLKAPEVQKMPGGRPSRYMFVKSGVNLTLKQSRSEAMVWATDIDAKALGEIERRVRGWFAEHAETFARVHSVNGEVEVVAARSYDPPRPSTNAVLILRGKL